MLKRNIQSLEMKEVLPIVKVCDRDVFLKRTCRNAPDRPLLGFGHDIPNLSGTPFSNRCGFMIMPHC